MEVWKDINGYEGLYQVSNCGNIKSLAHFVTNNKNGAVRLIKEKMLSPTDNGKGYKIIGLRKKTKRKNHYVHRLVACAFIDNPRMCNYVNHKDYDRSNNVVQNLEWCTQGENVRYSAENMRKPKNNSRSSTGYKYVCKYKNGYRVMIKPLQICKQFMNLIDAVNFRNEVMK